jgi:integrase
MPLGFKRLAAEWLDHKAGQIKASSLSSFRSGIIRAIDAWGNANIKSIGYAQIEDFLKGYPGAPKTKLNVLIALKLLWSWVEDRYDVPPLKKWPKAGFVEMAFRDTVDIPTQEAILNNIKEHEPFRVWLCIKWLATYIAIRPGEMRSLTEGQVDRQRGFLVVPHPKEKRAKIIPMTEEDIEIVRSLPLAFDSSMPFFRHQRNIKGGTKAGDALGHNSIYRAWKRACGRLGVQGVSLYPGTKHSTAMGYREIYTPEQIQSMTLHSTSAAFNRYFQTGGEDLRKLLEGRKTLVTSDHGLTTNNAAPSNSQVFNFKG